MSNHSAGGRAPGSARCWRLALAIACVLAARDLAIAEPTMLVGLAPSRDARDARKAIAIGPAGEVYEPDGRGAWVRTASFTTATTLAIVGRNANGVVASGGGVVYLLAGTGWSAIRLAQKGDAVMSRGPRAVGAVKRQLYALDRFKAGEPEKLAVVPHPVTAMGAGKSIVVATERGAFRVEGGKASPLAGVPAHATLVGDRWAIAGGGALDLRSKQRTPWPVGAAISAFTTGTDDDLHAAGTHAGRLVLLSVRAGRLAQTPITAPIAGSRPVGLVVDREGRAVVAMADGRILVHDKGAWAATTVAETLPPPRPGPPPANSH